MMNKSMLIGIAIGAGVATTGGVIAGYQVFGKSAPDAPSTAVVTEASTDAMDHGAVHGAVAAPATEPAAAPSIARTDPAPVAAVRQPAPAPAQSAPVTPAPAPVQAEPVVREECWDEVVEVTSEPRDDKRIAGTAVGALIGGAVAKDLGDRDLTTAVGAAAGAVIGRRIQGRIQENRAETTTVVERRCAPAGSR